MPDSPVADPEFLPFKLDLVGQRVLWLRLNATQRRDAAFLDERALPKGVDGGWLPLESLLEVEVREEPAAAALFHIGHCGSTLLSRLLDGWNGTQSLREPLPMRTLAEAWPLLGQAPSRLAPQHAPKVLRGLWARWSTPLPPATRGLVKATSSCNGLITAVLAHLPRARVILLDQPLRAYLATLLKAPASVFDAAHAAGERLVDLQARGFAEGVALHSLTLPQQCAMGWLAERVRFHALAADARVLQVDFETLLGAPESTLQKIASHLGLDPEGVEMAMRSPAWSRYSKAENHHYTRDDRAHDLELARERQGDQIEAGTAWVAAMVQRYPELHALTFD